MKLSKKVSAASLAVSIAYGALALSAPATAATPDQESATIAATRLAHHCNGQCNGKCGSELESSRLPQGCNGQCSGKCSNDDDDGE